MLANSAFASNLRQRDRPDLHESYWARTPISDSASIAAAKRVRYSPGQVLITSEGPQVRRVLCESPQQIFCKKCCWCERCASKGNVTVLRKRQGARSDGEVSEVHLGNTCRTFGKE